MAKVSKYEDSERELSDHFTSALFVRAQKYETTYGAPHETDAIHEALLDWRHREELRTFLAVDRTLRSVSAASRACLAWVLEPHAWPGNVDKDREEARSPIEVAFRRPRGSFVALAIHARSTRDVMQLRKKTCTPLEFLIDEARDPKKFAKIRKTILLDCERLYQPHIAEYDAARTLRLEEEAQARVETKARRERERRAIMRGMRAPSPALLDASDAVLELAKLLGVAS